MTINCSASFLIVKRKMDAMQDYSKIVSICLLTGAMHKGYGKKLMPGVIGDRSAAKYLPILES